MTGFQGMVGFDISYAFIRRAGMVENHPWYNFPQCASIVLGRPRWLSYTYGMGCSSTVCGFYPDVIGELFHTFHSLSPCGCLTQSVLKAALKRYHFIFSECGAVYVNEIGFTKLSDICTCIYMNKINNFRWLGIVIWLRLFYAIQNIVIYTGNTERN